MLQKVFTAQIIEESPAYPFSQMLSDCGGTLDLYIGLNIVSTFEIIHLLSLLRYVSAFGKCLAGRRSAQTHEIVQEIVAIKCNTGQMTNSATTRTAHELTTQHLSTTATMILICLIT